MKKILITIIIIILLFDLTGCNKHINTNENKIITANEAKKISQNIKCIDTTEAIKYINQRILDSANNGNNSIWYFAKLSEKDLKFIKEIYENRGYKVITQYKILNNNSEIEITWDTNENQN